MLRRNKNLRRAVHRAAISQGAPQAKKILGTYASFTDFLAVERVSSSSLGGPKHDILVHFSDFSAF